MIELFKINDLAEKKVIELYLLYKKKNDRSVGNGQSSPLRIQIAIPIRHKSSEYLAVLL